MGKNAVFFIIFMLGLFFPVKSYAQNNNETLTITTYYPAPHGVYRQLRSSELVVGSPGSPSDFATFPGAITLKPVTAPPAANTQPIGTLYFDNAEKIYKFYNGTGGWQNLSASGTGAQQGNATQWAGKGTIQVGGWPDGAGGCAGHFSSCTNLAYPAVCTGASPSSVLGCDAAAGWHVYTVSQMSCPGCVCQPDYWQTITCFKLP
jgi:hypothetical protein